MRLKVMGVVLLAVTGQMVSAAEFKEPIMLKGGDDAVRSEAPGYASPCWADIDQDGKKDLLVGQFADGKIKVYRNLGQKALMEGKLGAGEWLQAEGEIAVVPGVW